MKALNLLNIVYQKHPKLGRSNKTLRIEQLNHSNPQWNSNEDSNQQEWIFPAPDCSPPQADCPSPEADCDFPDDFPDDFLDDFEIDESLEQI
jgi:hypothetical protein